MKFPVAIIAIRSIKDGLLTKTKANANAKARANASANAKLKGNAKVKASAAIFIAASYLMLTSSSAAYAADQGWLIDQEDRINGPRTIYLSKRGIRIESKSDQSIVVSRPPTWTVITFSNQSKKYFECPADKFVNSLSKPIAVWWGMNLATLPMKVGPVVTKYGVPVTSYESSIVYDSKFWNRDVNDKNSRRLPLSAAAFYTDTFKVPAQEADVLTRLSNIPALGGVPLMFSYKDQDKDFHFEVRTFTVKSVDVTKVGFVQPAGFKRVSSAREALKRDDRDDALKELF